MGAKIQIGRFSFGEDLAYVPRGTANLSISMVSRGTSYLK
jgi:hypothetical protein